VAPRAHPSAVHTRAEWARASAFVVATAGLSLMAIADVRDQTAWWLIGLAVAVAGTGGLIGAALVLPDARRLFGALFGWRPANALKAAVDLNRIPAAPAAHRLPRVIANVFGPLSAAAGILMIARLLGS
jgi:hypothetical protein